MIDEGMLRRIEAYWAAELGFAKELLRIPGSTVVARSDSTGAFIFRHDECYIWQVPEPFMHKIEGIVGASSDASLLFQKHSLEQMFGPAAQLVLGPCPIAYCGRNSLCSVDGLPASRRLIETDRPALESLAIACGTEAWEHGGVEWEKHPAVFGCFAEGRLVSAASYEIWGDVIAHVGVVTAPAHRGQGFGKAAARAATNHALKEDLAPQWRTLASNSASVSVGKSLGFEAWATHFYVRLAPEPV